MSVWVNIDKGNQNYTIHDSVCDYVKNNTNPPGRTKSIGFPLKFNGGWVEFDTIQDAENLHNQHQQYSKYNLIKHKCLL